MSWQDRDYNRDPDSVSGAGPGIGDAIARLRVMSITLWIIVINVAVFVIDMLIRGKSNSPGPLESFGYFSADKAIYHHEVWRFITFQFLHANGKHILFNMFTLYFFGPMVERYLGWRRFIVFYLLCGMAGAVSYLLLWKLGLLISDPATMLIGASAGIFGVLIAAAKIAPDASVMLILLPIPMKLRTMAWAFIGIAVVTIFFNLNNAGGEAAHLGGAALGFVLITWPRLLSLPHAAGTRIAGIPEPPRWNDAAVDRILDKVREHGLASLTDAEKHALQRASERKRR